MSAKTESEVWTMQDTDRDETKPATSAIESRTSIDRAELRRRRQEAQKKRQEESLQILKAVPWCATILQDPALVIHMPRSRIMPSHNNSDTFFGQLLSSKDTIRAQVMLRSRIHTNTAYPRVDETIMLFALGRMLTGHANVAHGGLAATLLDETLGLLINVNEDVEKEVNPTHRYKQIMTRYLNLTYNKPVPAPGIVITRARFVRIEGRKRFIRGTIEDEHGTVLTEADALFLELKQRLKL
jgi:acyl-coenzyme A thioesterase THEM4